MSSLSNKKILILGANSMLGRRAKKYLSRYTDKIYEPGHDYLDLLWESQVFNYFESIRPDYLIYAAGYNGNIQFNKKNPVKIINDTCQMALNVMRYASFYNVKTLSFISSCAYPNQCLLKEDEFWNGRPDDSVSAHGFGKRLILELVEQYKKEYNFHHIGMCINTCYGKWDNFNSNKSKVIGSLITKFSTAKKENLPSVKLLGNGSNRREFIYCDDVGKYLPLLLEYDKDLPLINIGSGIDYSIKETAELIKNLIGYQGQIEWSGQDGGQQEKRLDNTKMKQIFGDLKFTPLDEGLQKTIDWYNKNEV